MDYNMVENSNVFMENNFASEKGKNKVLSKEIAIECGIFQGDSLSPT